MSLQMKTRSTTRAEAERYQVETRSQARAAMAPPVSKDTLKRPAVATYKQPKRKQRAKIPQMPERSQNLGSKRAQGSKATQNFSSRKQLNDTAAAGAGKRVRHKVEKVCLEDSESASLLPIARNEEFCDGISDLVQRPQQKITSVAAATPWSSLSLFSE